MPKRILLVEDEEGLALLMGDSLTELGPDYTIEVCRSGAEALARMASRKFNLVISDLRMPGIDGLALLSEVRRLYPDTRLILMTASSDRQVRAMARQLQVHQCIIKPFRVEELLAAVRKAIGDEASL